MIFEKKDNAVRKLIIALALGVSMPTLAFAAVPKGLDARLEAVRQKVGAPGLAVAIVEDGKVTWSKGYGVKTLGKPDKVDADTLFQIGSVSKNFTAAALATLVDEGKIKWDDPVIDHLPGFQMWDPYVTRELTVRDLLVHRSGLGLGQGDLMFLPATTISRAETVRRIRYLKPVTSFRSAYAYDNVLYMVAGQLIEQVTGQPWEVYVRDRLLRPAGMANSVTNDADRYAAPDHALPHGRLGEIRGLGEQRALDEKAVALGANSAPAGAIASSANEMARWIQVQLSGGQVAGSDKRLFSAANGKEMWKPVTPMPIAPLPGALAEAMPQFSSYALGWRVQDYRGHRIVSHTGGTVGFRANLVLIPEKNVGFVILENAEENELISGLQNELLDHYLGLPKRDWVDAYGKFFGARNAEGLAAVKSASQARAKTSPSLPLSGYAGTYVDPWYGPMEIREKDGGLTIDFKQTPGMSGPLEHWGYDTFVARWKDPTTEPAYVSFALDPDGKPDRVTMKPFSPVADFSYDYQDLLFTPVAGK
jgi:CubicO group peptidase (beta-lactamase class C family)